MDKKSLLHMLDFDEVYCYLATGQKTKEEIVQFFEERGVAPSTVRRYMKVLQNVDNGMLIYTNGVFGLDEERIKSVIAQVLDELHIPINLGESSYISIAEKENQKLAEQIRQLENKIHEKEEEKESLKRYIQEQEKNLTEKHDEILQLIEECKCLKREQIKKQLDRDVVYVKALSLDPGPNAKEQLFLDDVIVHLDLDKSISKYGGRRPSFYHIDTVGEEQILNEKNYYTYLGEKMFSVPFLKDWLKQMGREKEIRNLSGLQSKSVSAKQVKQDTYDKKSPLDKRIEEYLRQRMISVETLLNDDRLSDQMKLQLYRACLCNRCNTARPVPRPRRHRRGPPRSLQGAKAPYIWPASFCNTSRQSCSHGFQRLSPVPLDGAAGHSHHRADLAVRQFQDTMQYQDALSRLGQAGKGSGHQPVADLKLTAIGRKYKTVAGVLIYRA